MDTVTAKALLAKSVFWQQLSQSLSGKVMLVLVASKCSQFSPSSRGTELLLNQGYTKTNEPNGKGQGNGDSSHS